MIEIPAALKERLRRRQVVLVAGLGCSRLAEAPGWEELALRLADRVDDRARRNELKELVALGRCADAIAFLGARLPREAIAATLADAYPAPGDLPPVIAALARLPLRGVISTGFDGLWAAAAGGAARLFGPDDGAAVINHLTSQSGPFVWQLGGVAASPDGPSMAALTPRRAARATPAPIAGAAATLCMLAERSSFLFAGFRARDPDLGLLAEMLAGAPRGGGPHLLLLSGARELETDLVEADLGASAVTTDAPLGEALEALARTLGDVAGARPADDDVEAWLELLSRDPDDPEPRVMLARAEARLRAQENWRGVIQLLLGRVERGTDREERVAVLRGIARIYETRLDAPDRAFTALVTALHLDPLAEGLAAEVERAAARAGLADELASAYADIYEKAGDAPMSESYRLELGRRFERSGEKEKAIAAYQGLLADAPGHAEALRALAGLHEESGQVDRHREVLEQMLRVDPDDDGALAALARIHRAAGRWPELAGVLVRRIVVAGSPSAKRELWTALGAAYDEHLHDPVRAAEAYASAVTLGDRGEATLAALARLEEQNGSWASAAETLQKLAAVAREPAACARALAGAARIAERQLGDPVAAEVLYTRALEHDGGNVSLLTTLAELCRGQGDIVRAAELLEQASACATDPAQQAALLFELAVVQEDDLGDPTEAGRLYARILEADPEHAPAARRMAGLHAGAERWEALEPLLALLARVAPDACAELTARPAVVRGIGELYIASGRWGEAAAVYQKAVDQQQEAAPAAERIDLLQSLARCRMALGESDAALDCQERVLGIDPARPDAIEALASAHIAGDSFTALAVGGQILRYVSDNETRGQLCEAIGDLYRETFDDRAQAIAAYRAALALAPGRRQTLYRLLELYALDKRWREAASAWERLAELDERPVSRAKCLFAAAIIARDELGDDAGCVSLLDRALDQAPELTKAFDALEEVLVRTQAWPELERRTRRMLERLPAEGFSELRLRLLGALGELALAHLDDPASAVSAFEAAAALAPDGAPRRERLADAYLEAGPSFHDKALAEHQQLIAHNPDRLASYQALAKLYARVGAVDQLWCVAGTLAFLRRAAPELQKFHEAHRPRTFSAARRPFDEQLWRKLAHPSEDPLLGALFGLIGPYLGAVAPPRDDAGLRRKDRVDTAADGHPVAQALRYVAGTFDLPLPDLFFKPDDPGGLSLVSLRAGPALVAGKGTDRRTSENELVFEMGQRLALLRPERFVRCLFAGPAELGTTVHAALAVAQVPAGKDDRGSLAARLRRAIPRLVLDSAAPIARELAAARGELIDLAGWTTAADLTAARAAFALTSDLAAAARVISTDTAAGSALAPKARLKDLIAFSVSPQHFEARKFLGLEIAATAAPPPAWEEPEPRARRRSGRLQLI
jgi:tetratricopeptide (TPR) repeat protein